MKKFLFLLLTVMMLLGAASTTFAKCAMWLYEPKMR